MARRGTKRAVLVPLVPRFEYPPDFFCLAGKPNIEFVGYREVDDDGIDDDEAFDANGEKAKGERAKKASEKELWVGGLPASHATEEHVARLLSTANVHAGSITLRVKPGVPTSLLILQGNTLLPF